MIQLVPRFSPRSSCLFVIAANRAGQDVCECTPDLGLYAILSANCRRDDEDDGALRRRDLWQKLLRNDFCASAARMKTTTRRMRARIDINSDDNDE